MEMFPLVVLFTMFFFLSIESFVKASTEVRLQGHHYRFLLVVTLYRGDSEKQGHHVSSQGMRAVISSPSSPQAS